MGSYIHLCIDDFELDWGKNDGFVHHSALFSPDDVQIVPYHYADDVTEQREAYARPLGRVVPRLDLLGYSLAAIRRLYMPKNRDGTDAFELLAAALRGVDLDQAIAYKKTSDAWPLPSPGEILFRCANPQGADADFSIVTEDFLEHLDPYIILRLLAENPVNRNRLVIWRYADVLEGGWVAREDLEPRRPKRYMLITEGSSDAAIINKALSLLRPDVADFFYSIDMKENYPFSGVGNLYRFVQGLAKIRIINSVIVIFDNDQAGSSAYARTIDLRLPGNIRPMKLPDLPEFEHFLTLGPTGLHRANINGSGASIECYLDLKYETNDVPKVRWHAYDAPSGRYQGVLENKAQYATRFFDLRGREPTYDFSKLEILLSALLSTCEEVP